MSLRAVLVVLLSVVFPAVGGVVAQDALRPGASGGELIPEQAAFDVLHYDLALVIAPEARTLQGRLVMRARVVAASERWALDLDHHLDVTQLVVDGDEVEFEHRDGRIWFAAPGGADGEVTVEVGYGGAPRVAPRPPWDGGFTWARTRDGQPWIATSCQGEGADLWWPCKDHPSDKPDTMDLHITVPSGLVCASNGTLIETEEADGHTVHHWHVANPISNYNVALNIAPYRVVESEFESVGGETVPVRFWCLPESHDKAVAILPQFLDHLEFFEDVCGPYPFRNEKYGIAETPHLGMEHQTIIAYGNEFRRGPFDYDWLHHHEASHEWWANLVTCRDWKDMWLHEGFGTYMQALYIERTHGPAGYRTEMLTKRRSLNNRKAVAPRETCDSKEIYFLPGGAGHDNDIYYKGSWILHTLRWAIGDEAFFEAVRRMAYPDPEMEKVTDGSQVRFAETEDFRRIAEAAAGRPLDWFFEVYLRQPALPTLEHQVVDGVLELRWQVPGDLPFSMPIPVEVGGEIVRVEIENGVGRVTVGDADWKIDPDQWLLRE